jgi:hypothetical protein
MLPAARSTEKLTNEVIFTDLGIAVTMTVHVLLMHALALHPPVVLHAVPPGILELMVNVPLAQLLHVEFDVLYAKLNVPVVQLDAVAVTTQFPKPE